MPAKHYPLIFALILVLPLLGCAPVENTAGQVATDIKDNVYQTSAKVKEWALTSPEDKKPPLPVKDSYCYYVLQDILCYRQPMPGWENRLAGYQGTDAKAPSPAVMQPLPVHSIDANALPAQRAANAKPVFASAPPDVQNSDKDSAANTPATETHEQLPDPALAPQL